MHIVCYVLHAKFDVLAIIHVILLNIPDNYDKIRWIRRRSIGSHKFKIQKMHVLCQHILLDFIFREIYKNVHHWRNIVRKVYVYKVKMISRHVNYFNILNFLSVNSTTEKTCINVHFKCACQYLKYRSRQHDV